MSSGSLSGRVRRYWQGGWSLVAQFAPALVVAYTLRAEMEGEHIVIRVIGVALISITAQTGGMLAYWLLGGFLASMAEGSPFALLETRSLSSETDSERDLNRRFSTVAESSTPGSNAAVILAALVWSWGYARG